jgi:hypothetical protein
MAKKKAKAKTTKKAKAKTAELSEEEKWEKARAEVQPKPGRVSRLVQLPQTYASLDFEERCHWIRKLRIEECYFLERWENVSLEKNPSLWRKIDKFLDEIHSDFLRVRYHGEVWMALGHLSRMVESHSSCWRVERLERAMARLQHALILDEGEEL